MKRIFSILIVLFNISDAAAFNSPNTKLITSPTHDEGLKGFLANALFKSSFHNYNFEFKRNKEFLLHSENATLKGEYKVIAPNHIAMSVTKSDKSDAVDFVLSDVRLKDGKLLAKLNHKDAITLEKVTL